jgi:SAM-dependent methyltransferase
LAVPHRITSHDGRAKRKAQRPAHEGAVRPAIVRLVALRTNAQGSIEVPCIPALLDDYVSQLTNLWETLGKPFSANESDKLRELLARGLQTGYLASPHATLIIQYQTQSLPQLGITYTAHVKVLTTTEMYGQWLAQRTPPLFGKLPDAKLVDLAALLGEPQSAPFLDVGAGTGRNAIALALRGHPTTAVEVAPALASEMRKAATAARAALDVIEGDILSPELPLATGHYKLVVMAEVITHFRHVSDVRSAFARFADAVAPGGLVLVSVFVAMRGYQPDDLAREAAQTAWSSAFTPADLKFITEELPFDRVSDESVYEYEREHLPAEGWPPTGWFIDWSQGRDIADLPAGRTPIELRWLVYRRR